MLTDYNSVKSTLTKHIHMFWTVEITIKNVFHKNVKIGFEIGPAIILKPTYANNVCSL